MKGILFALGAGTFLAFTYSLDKLALAKYGIPPLWGAFCRFWVATIIISVWATVQFQNQAITDQMKASTGIMFCAGITFAIAVWCIVSSMKYLPSGQATVINNTTGVILTCLIGASLLNEEFSGVKLVGVVLAVIGIFLVAR